MNNTKYYQMHADILELCSSNDIRLIPGKVAYVDVLSGALHGAKKTFFCMPDEYERLKELLNLLDKDTYSVLKAGKQNSYISIKRIDILATSIKDLMNYPKGSYHPVIIIRPLVKSDENTFQVTLNKKNIPVPKDTIGKPVQTGHPAGKVFLPEHVDEFISLLYGTIVSDVSPVQAYPIFSEDLSLEELIRRAADENLMSEKMIALEKEYQDFNKKTKAPILKKYKNYQDRLLNYKL